jgi:hypothetical protein
MLKADIQRAEVGRGEKFWVNLIHFDIDGRQTCMGIGPFKASEALRQKEILESILLKESAGK